MTPPLFPNHAEASRSRRCPAKSPAPPRRRSSPRSQPAAPRGNWFWPAWVAGGLVLWAVEATAQLQIVPPETTPAVFAGSARRLPVVFNNPDAQPVTVRIRPQLWQTSATTAAPWPPAGADSSITALPGQTVVVSPSLDLPPVRFGTLFVVHWWTADDRLLGVGELWVYPTNLLHGLRDLAGSTTPIGVVDPAGEWDAALATGDLAMTHLSPATLQNYRGRLLLVAAPRPGSDWPVDMPARIAGLAKAGVAVVWVQPTPAPGATPEPGLEFVRIGAVAVARPPARALHALAEKPRAQLSLLRAAELACQPALLAPAMLLPFANP